MTGLEKTSTPTLPTSEWNKMSHNFGIHAAGVSLSTVFEYQGSRKIQSWKTSCGCTGSSMNDNKFTVTYKTKEVSESLVSIGVREQSTKQQLYVTFEDGTQDHLQISVIVSLDKQESDGV